MEYLAPTHLDDALEALAAGPLTVVAGGTDFYPARVGRPITESVLDISGLAELTGIGITDDAYRIGALTRWAEIRHAHLPGAFDGLRRAAREVGAVQVQNAGTIGGNLCNASPAADGIPPLLTLDASVELVSLTGVRTVTLEDFLTGYRQTDRRAGELVTAVTVPRAVENGHGDFLKLGSRAYLVISIVMVAGLIETDQDGIITDARLAVGACSPVARRLTALEADLRGQPIGGELATVVTSEHLAVLSPIDDVRASAAYRLDAALTLVRRVLDRAGGRS
jgi:CO/xanthine dehydrogenase FAD-binding subunit